MEKLDEAIRNLDKEEPVEKFRDEARRVVYFDEENQQYFVEESGIRKNIGIGDIVSDYAWGIKYVPNEEIAKPAYRTLAKKILVNETRRDLEELHNSELIVQKPHRLGVTSFFRISWPRIKEAAKSGDVKELEEKLVQAGGFIAEVSIRDFLSRISLNLGLNLIISRATVEEDADYKYDFKARVKQRTRGIDVQSQNISSVGFQLKSKTKRGKSNVAYGQPLKIKVGARGEVDEIIILKVPGKEFITTTKKWLDANEPSGGPEQFLSPELKKAILKAVAEKLTNIPQSVFDKIE